MQVTVGEPNEAGGFHSSEASLSRAALVLCCVVSPVHIQKLAAQLFLCASTPADPRRFVVALVRGCDAGDRLLSGNKILSRSQGSGGHES